MTSDKAKELSDLCNIVIDEKQPHIVFTNPEKQIDTATWQPKIPPKKTPKLIKAEVDEVTKKNLQLHDKIENLANWTTFSKDVRADPKEFSKSKTSTHGLKTHVREK